MVPFIVGDVLLVAAAILIYAQGGRPMNAVETSVFGACMVGGALVGVWPFVLKNKAALKTYEVNELTNTLSQIQRSEEVAQSIATATGQWHAVQEQAASTLAAAREITENMANALKEFRELFNRAADTERNTLRLEVSKLRRAEADWLHVLVRIMDHVYALYTAGVRSGQPTLIEQFTNFQNACRDAARRVGFVPVLATPGTPFDPEVHQVLNPSEPVPTNATVAEMLATGYAYQGQLIRRVLVAVRAAEPQNAGTSAVIESFSSTGPGTTPATQPSGEPEPEKQDGHNSNVGRQTDGQKESTTSSPELRSVENPEP